MTTADAVGQAWRRGATFDDLADALLPAVAEVARLQRDALRSGVAVERKSDHTPVTAVDRASEAVLLQALQAVAPDVPVVAEEAMAAGACAVVGDLFFLVDPLDGTREFINGRSEFTINVGLVSHGLPVFGLICRAVTGDLYLTRSPAQAVHTRLPLDGAAAPALSTAAMPWTSLRARVPPAAGLDVLLSRSHMNRETEAALSSVSIASRRPVGSSLKFCLIAAGEADLHVRVGPTSEWDIAAGHALLTAAGGRLLGLDGGRISYGKVARRFLNDAFVALGRETPWPPGTTGEQR